MKYTSFFLIFFSINLIAREFSLHFENVPKTTGFNCHEQAKTLTEAFKKSTGMKKADVVCVHDEAGRADFDVTYEADKALNTADTRQSIGNYLGIYKEEKDCIKNLPAQTQTFEAATVVKAFLSYCDSEGEYSRRPWYPRIIGFGDVKRLPQISSYAYFSAPEKFDASGFRAGLTKAIAERGGVFAEVASHASLGYGTMAIHYYAPEPIHFELFEMTKRPDQKVCLGNMDRLLKALSLQKISAVTTYCGYVQVGGNWELTALFAAPLAVGMRPSVEVYPSLKDCDDEREKLLAYYQKKVDAKIFEGFCSSEQQGYVVNFLRKN